MKKKGLIVATIVMVLVLAVSLTTATYAWFTASAEAEIQTIALTVGESPNLLVGVKNKAIGSTTSAYADYSTGTMTHTGTVWSGDAGLGAGNIDFSEQLNGEGSAWAVGKAVSYTTTALTHTPVDDPETDGVDESVANAVNIPKDSWFKAYGDSTTSYDVATAQAANNGVDYIDVTFIVAIGKEKTVNQTYLQIKVTPTGGAANLGMAAALHFFISVGNAGQAETAFVPLTYTITGGTTANNYTTNPGNTLSAYQGKTYANGWSETVQVGAYDSTDGSWTLIVPIHTFNSTAYAANFNTSKQVRLIIWIEGSDESCVTANAGTSASIDISFVESATEVEIASNGTITTTP